MRHHFDDPVTTYMTHALEVARLGTPVDQLARVMHDRGISGVPIVDDHGTLVGVVTRTDLIKLGLLQAGLRPHDRVMPLPARRADEVMTREPFEVTTTTSLRHAARVMIDHQIHRVFVTDAGALVGILCTIDLAMAVHHTRIDAPLSTVMTSPVVTVDVADPLGAAVALLDRVHVAGLIVTEAGQPIGMFSQLEALASRELPRSTPVEAVYSAAVICLPEEMKLHRAAAQVAQLEVRRVVACKAREAVGIVTATDFARIVARS
jgi:CBS domain-containing protein